MTKLYIQSFNCCFPDPENEKESIATLIPDIPKRAARRMSKLGKQLHHVMSGIALDLDTTLIYGTTFTETVALETFLDSIPFASPTAFQTSIHPGGIEQALIMNKQEVGAFFPIAGKQNLFLQMLQTAFTSTTQRSVLAGGEEKGTWLIPFNIAYPVSFAFSICLTFDSSNAIGEINWQPTCSMESPTSPCLEDVVRILQRSENLRIGSPDHGQFELSWK